jgi:uncharacterized protein (TIGR03067 family)
MTNLDSWLRKQTRAVVMFVVAIVIVGISYSIANALHRSAIGQLSAGKACIVRADWLGAIQCFDRALLRYRYLPEAHLLRATAIDGYISTSHKMPRGHSRDTALEDLETVLRHEPNSGEAHYQRGLALSGLAKVEEAREAFAHAIKLLPDPSKALVERAGLSFHTREYATAVDEISGAIARHPLVAEYYADRSLYRKFIQDHAGSRLDQAKADRLLDTSKPASLEDLEALEKESRAGSEPIEEPQDTSVVRAEQIRFEGTWNIVARGARGESVDTTDRIFFLRFDRNTYAMVLDGKTAQSATFSIDPQRRPCQIDWVAKIRDKPVTLLGIYEFRGKTLKICMGNAGEARPTEFTSDERDMAVLYTLAPRKP